MQQENVIAMATYIGGRLREVIQKGMPEVGWEGDPLIVPMFDPRTEHWLIVDQATKSIIMRRPYQGIRDLDYRDICRRLKAAQVPREKGTHTVFDRMLARQKAREEEAARVMREDHIEVALAMQDTASHRKIFV